MPYRIPPDLVIGPSAEFLPLAGEVNWGMDKFAIERLRKLITTTIKLGVVDTGVDKSHPLLSNVVAAKDFTGSASGSNDRHGHGCVAPWDKVVTSLCGLQTSEYLFDNAPGIAHFFPDRQAIIKDVSRYDVYTFSADPKTGEPVKAKVLAVHKLKHKGPVFKVKTGDGELTLTPWHPVYVVTSHRGTERTITKRRADELKTGDSVLLSGSGPDVGQTVKVPYRTRWQCVGCGYESRGGERQRCRQCDKPHWHEGPKTEEKVIDADVAFWLGLVASDGHVDKRQPCIDFTNKDEKIGQVFSDLCVKLFGIAPKRYQYGERAATWRIHSKDVRQFAIACGIPAGNKSRTLRIPNLITKSPRAIVMSFLAGMLEGDGNIRAKIRLRTGSLEFAEELLILLHTFGIYSRYSTEIDPKCGRPNYLISIGGDSELCKSLRVKDGGVVTAGKRKVSASILSIEEVEYDGPMYDLTVEGTTTYVANGHVVSNTHCSGTVGATDPRIGVASGFPLYHGKGLDDSGSGGSGLIRAIEWCLSEGCEIVSNSWGGGGQNSDWEKYFREVAESPSRPWLIFAGGNSGSGTPDTDWPGRSQHLINVAALNPDLTPASFSSSGDKIDTSGPGVNIWSCRPGGGFQQMSGTSMATPFICGLLGLYRAGLKQAKLPIPTIYELRKLLFSDSTDTHTPGDDRRSGPGWLTPILLSLNLIPDPPRVE